MASSVCAASCCRRLFSRVRISMRSFNVCLHRVSCVSKRSLSVARCLCTESKAARCSLVVSVRRASRTQVCSRRSYSKPFCKVRSWALVLSSAKRAVSGVCGSLTTSVAIGNGGRRVCQW